MITFTANQLLGRHLHVAHQTAAGCALLCKGTATLPHTTAYSDVQYGIKNKKYILLWICLLLLLTPSLGIVALLRRPILDQWGTLHTLILCRITSRSKPKMSWPCRKRIEISIIILTMTKHCTFNWNCIKWLYANMSYSPPAHQGQFCATWPGRSQAESSLWQLSPLCRSDRRGETRYSFGQIQWRKQRQIYALHQLNGINYLFKLNQTTIL